MDSELRDLLRTVAIDPTGDSYTHISIYGSRTRYNIRPQTQLNFWTGYCDLVDRKNNGDEESGIQPDPFANLCLAERQQPVMPLISKLTFKFHADENNDEERENWEPYDDHFIQWLCHIYQVVLMEYFSITTETQMELVAAVLESTTHWYEEDRESGQRFMMMEVKLHFPYARIDANLQNNLVRTRVITLLRNNNILSKMQRQPVGDWEQIIATNITSEPVLLYGGCEIQSRPKLELTHIWTTITKDMLDNGYQPEEISLEDSFVPTNHMHIQQLSANGNIFDDHDLKHWLPMFLSLGYWPTVLLSKQDVPDVGRHSTQSRNTNAEQGHIFGTSTNRHHVDTDDDKMELSETMLSMILPTRYLREAFWLDIGKALYVSDEGGDNGLRAWINHTERSINGVSPTPVYMMVDGTLADTCRNLYYTFANSHITVETLAWYAREDSPDRYSNWHRDWCMSSMEQALSGFHTDITVALHHVYWLDFAYCPIGKGKWFRFRNHRWTEVNQGIDLRKAISSDFMKRFEATRVVLCRQVNESNDESFRSTGEITIKRITMLIGKLKTVSVKSCIMTEACEHFKKDNFMSLLDTNPDITGVTNGVLELSGDHVLFRRAKPEDYISMCTNIPYHENYTWEHPLVRECMKWFGQVFTDKSLLHHFLKFSASCLKGRNSDKLFPIFTGDGDNSKSMIVKLFEATFASYCIKFDISNLTGKAANSSGPTPQLARAKSTRVAFVDEPEDDIPMNKGFIKKLIGGDSFFCRLLQENGGDVQVTFKMVLTCNKVPIIPNADKAIKNRTRLFPFQSTWVKEGASESEAEQYRTKTFKMDGFFERRIPVLAPAFLWIMTQYYPHYVTDKLVDPPIILEVTEAYWRDNDVYAQFAADTIEEVYDTNNMRDASARVTLSEIYGEFKVWFKDAFPGNPIPVRSIVRSELSSRWGRLNGTCWHGIKINTNMSSSLSDVKPTPKSGNTTLKGGNPVLIAPVANLKTPNHQSAIPDFNKSNPVGILAKPITPKFNLVNPPKFSPKTSNFQDSLKNTGNFTNPTIGSFGINNFSGGLYPNPINTILI